MNINEQICPRFVLEFYHSVVLSSNDEGDFMTVFFKANRNQYHFPLLDFAQTLGLPCEGACVYSDEWSLSVLDTHMPHGTPYQTPLLDKETIRDHLFVDQVQTTQVK